jgi:hypothetical protein
MIPFSIPEFSGVPGGRDRNAMLGTQPSAPGISRMRDCQDPVGLKPGESDDQRGKAFGRQPPKLEGRILSPSEKRVKADRTVFGRAPEGETRRVGRAAVIRGAGPPGQSRNLSAVRTERISRGGAEHAERPTHHRSDPDLVCRQGNRHLSAPSATPRETLRFARSGRRRHRSEEVTNRWVATTRKMLEFRLQAVRMILTPVGRRRGLPRLDPPYLAAISSSR